MACTCECQPWLGLYYCSLIYKAARDADQLIPSKEWTIVRFPFGAAESWDGHRMHQVLQPDGAETSYGHERSGLIWPHISGAALLAGKANWDDGDYSQILARFIRDPLGLGDGKVNDWTATTGDPPTPGGEHETYAWPLLVSPGTPVAFQVWHSASGPIRLTQGQFKIMIWPLAPPL